VVVADDVGSRESPAFLVVRACRVRADHEHGRADWHPALHGAPRTKGESAGSPNAQTTCTFDAIFPISPDEAQRFGLPPGTTGIENVGTVTGFFSSGN
jgi:hypothetical protein